MIDSAVVWERNDRISDRNQSKIVDFRDLDIYRCSLTSMKLSINTVKSHLKSICLCCLILRAQNNRDISRSALSWPVLWSWFLNRNYRAIFWRLQLSTSKFFCQKFELDYEALIFLKTIGEGSSQKLSYCVMIIELVLEPHAINNELMISSFDHFFDLLHVWAEFRHQILVQ